MTAQSELPPAVVLAGGKGERLRSEVADRPKPLAWVGGRFFLSHILQWLREAGVPRVVLATGHKGEMIRELYGDSFGGMPLLYSSEESPQGTAGALRMAIAEFSEDRFFALNGDSWCPMDLASFWRQSHPSSSWIATRQMPGLRYGCIQTDEKGTTFEEKPAERSVKTSTGIYLLSRQALADLVPGTPSSLETDLFPQLARQGQLSCWDVGDVPFVDIGLPDSLHQARQMMARSLPGKFSSLEEIISTSPACAKMFAPRRSSQITGFKLAVGVVLRDIEGRILLELRPDCGLWGLPGGRIDFGESISETAHREVAEETGLTMAIERLVGVYSRPEGRVLTYHEDDVVQPITVVVEASVRGGVLSLSPESLDLQFFTEHQLPPNLLPAVRECLADCLSNPLPAVR